MNYIVDHIPRDTPNNRRPGIKMNPTTITIHNTANPTSTARNERAWLTNPTNNRTASYHIVVDEREAIECLPLDEVAWHAGDGRTAGGGNMASIGIEICESGNYAMNVENAAELVAKMLLERGWGVDRLRRHWDWSKKICPRKMYDNGSWNGWDGFKRQVQQKMNQLKGANQVKKVEGQATITYKGKQLQGIIVDSVSYVPVRDMAQLMGLQVNWNAHTKTVELK